MLYKQLFGNQLSVFFLLLYFDMLLVESMDKEPVDMEGQLYMNSLHEPYLRLSHLISKFCFYPTG